MSFKPVLVLLLLVTVGRAQEPGATSVFKSVNEWARWQRPGPLLRDTLTQESLGE